MEDNVVAHQKSNCARGVCYCLLALFTVCASPKPDAFATDIMFMMTEEYPPFNFTGENGEVGGISTKILTSAAEKTNLSLRFELLPWMRSYTRAINTPNTCVYSTWRTEEREQLFKWIGPLANDAWSLFGTANSELVIEKIEDSFEHRIGAVRGWGFTDYLEKIEHPMLDLVTVDELNARKLNIGRIDLWATGRFSGRYLAKKLNLDEIREIFVVREIPVYVACNLNTSIELMTALQRGIDLIEQEGLADHIRSNQ